MDEMDYGFAEEFKNELEDLATSPRSCEIIFRDERGARGIIRDQIQGWASRDGTEYLQTASGLHIPLTRLISVNGKRPGTST